MSLMLLIFNEEFEEEFIIEFGDCDKHSVCCGEEEV